MSKKVQCPECNHVFFDSPPVSRFIPPSLDEVAAYCKERGNAVDPQKFLDHYGTSGWIRGKTKIKDWRACVRTWEQDARVKETVQGKLCPLCENYRIVGNGFVCDHCGPYCRRCNERTANIRVVKRKDGTRSAICIRCLGELKALSAGAASAGQ